jgi:short-subunit dehydrogenase
MRRILIMGATSAIAEATAREFARFGDALFLTGRDEARLRAIADDLKVRGARIVGVGVIDARDLAGLDALLDAADRTLGGLDAALIAHGTLPDQRACQESVAPMVEQFETNALSVMAICTLLANRFEAAGCGVIAVISSVAGDRGRQSNYAYGAAKAAVTAFASGLRQRLRGKNVQVVTIKPGFVDTPMTASFRKGVLWASAGTVGKSIARAMIRGDAVVYVPWFWRPIMAVIRSIPEFAFQRLRI